MFANGKPRPTDRWLIPGIVPLNGLVVIASAPKTGKTVLANAMARALCAGEPFDGEVLLPRIPVCWCCYEETLEERVPFLAGLPDDTPFYLGMAPDLMFLDDPDCGHRIDRFGRYNGDAQPFIYDKLRSMGVRFLVIDCLHGAVRHSNLADNQVARRIMGNLRHWSNEFGIATLVLHHLTKSAHRGYHPERFADSAQILAAASCYFFLEAEVLEDGKRKVVLSGAGRVPAPPARQELIADGYFDYRRVSFDTSRKAVPLAERINRLLEEGWHLTAEEIALRLKARPQSIRNALHGLEGIERVHTPSRPHRYRKAQPGYAPIHTTDCLGGAEYEEQV